LAPLERKGVTQCALRKKEKARIKKAKSRGNKLGGATAVRTVGRTGGEK